MFLLVVRIGGPNWIDVSFGGPNWIDVSFGGLNWWSDLAVQSGCTI